LLGGFGISPRWLSTVKDAALINQETKRGSPSTKDARVTASATAVTAAAAAAEKAAAAGETESAEADPEADPEVVVSR